MQRVGYHVDGIVGERAIDVGAGVVPGEVASGRVGTELIVVASVLFIKLSGVLSRPTQTEKHDWLIEDD